MAANEPFQTPKLTASQGHSLEAKYQPAYDAWKADPSPVNQSELLRQLNPVIDQAMRTYGGTSATSPTLRGRAKLLTLQALDTYDPTKAGLNTHVSRQLQRLQRLAVREGRGVSVPERAAMARNAMLKDEDELRITLGREPSLAELADHTGLSVRRITNLRALSSPIASGSMMSEDGMPEAPASRVPGAEPGAVAWATFVYDSLRPVDQAIFDHLRGRNGPAKSVQQVAALLNLTPSAVSQRAGKIEAALQERHKVHI